MKKNLTEIVFILDESGSMYGLKSDTIGGFNSFLAKQREQAGECLVNLVFFNDRSRVVYDREDLLKVRDLNKNDYNPCGSTALIDALGLAIKHIGNVHKYIRDEDRPEKTLFVIITDGMENSSVYYTSKKVKRMINDKKKAGWEFLFLGANIDAVKTADEYGIDCDHSATFTNDSEGVALNFEIVSNITSEYRQSKMLCPEALDSIRADHQKRK